MYKLNETEIKEMIIGCCLGDASIEYKNNKNNKYSLDCISFSQSEKQLEYLKYKRNNLLEFFYPNNIKLLNSTKYRENPQYRFRLNYGIEGNKNIIEYMSKNLKDLHRKRKLPDNLTIITPLVLYFWYMDDGFLTTRVEKNKVHIRKQLGIALKRYSDESILKLIDYIKNVYNIQFKPKKTKNKIGWIVIDNKLEITKFFDLLDLYIKNITPKKMEYKFCLFEIPQTRGNTYPSYNKCDCYKTGICTCRNKDFSLLIK